MKKNYTWLIAAYLLLSTSSFSQSWEWAKTFGGRDIDEGYTINCDNFGNSYITGSFSDTANFGTFQLISNGNDAMFFAKLDSNGIVLWAKSFGGSSSDYGYEIIPDPLGNCYILGSFQGTLNAGPFTLTSTGMTDMFIAKMDVNQNIVWAKKAGGTGNEDPFSIRLDEWGNLYAITPFQNTAYFDADSLVSNGGYDIAIVKYDGNGNVIWAKGAGGSGTDVPVSISIDATGNVIIGGQFQNSCTFGTFLVQSAGLWDVFISKYDSSGTILWVKNFGSTGNDANTIVRTDNKNDIYITGTFENTITIGNTNVTSAGYFDIFLAKCDSNGNFSWAAQAGGPSIENVVWGGMTIDQYSNMYLTGYYDDTATFGSFMLPGSNDIYVAKYDSTGICKWVTNATGPGAIQSQVGWGVAESNNNIYVIGSYLNNLSFTGSALTLSSLGNEHDIYVAKISQVSASINELTFSDNNISIIPNPANSLCTITSTFQNSGTLILYDITGRALMQQPFNTKVTLDISKLTNGVYIAYIIDKEGRSVKGKVVKE